jgi:subtilase family serine protease
MSGYLRGVLLSAGLLWGAWGCGSPEGLEAAPGEVKAVRQGLGYEPDFVVTKTTVPASAMPGNSFQSTVEVCNRGASGSGVDVNLYFSDDEVITASDFWAANFYVGYLAAGQCQSQAVWVTASVPSYGAWRLGGYADPYASQLESDETNNSLASGVFGVGYGADFVITSVTGPVSAQPGQFITAQVTVCNNGTQGDSTNVEVYVSVDDFIQPNVPPGPSADYLLGSAPTNYLNPGQCSTVPVTGNAYPPPPGSDGAFHLGGVVDPYDYRLELIEDNNTHEGYRLGLGYRPDFVITSVTGPASAQPGQFITAQVTVCNNGTQGDSTNVEVYVSVDATIQPNVPPGPSGDYLLGSAPTNYLNPGQCSTVPVTGYAYPPPPGSDGAFHLGGVVDPYDYRLELIEDNNSLAGYRLGLGYRPDFVVTSVTGPASAQPGQNITAQVTVCNNGTQGDSTDVEVYLSADDAIRAYVFPGPPEDSLVGMATTGYLYAGQCATVLVTGSASAPPPGGDGAYHLGAVVDPYQSRMELIEDNNSLAGYRMGLGNKPDFVVTAVTGPASAQSGQALTAQVTVCNKGTQGDSTDVELYLSADATIRANVPPGPSEDSWLGSAPVGYLYPSQCTTVSVTGNAYVPAPGSDGAYHLGAVVDSYNSRPELLEDNNTLAGYRMGVGNKADFVVTAVTGPASAQHGQALTAQVTVCNKGTQGDSTDVELYLSADATIRANVPPGPPEDSWLGSASTGWLYAGQCRTVAVSGNAYVPPPGGDGAYHLGAVADPYNSRQELIEDNNSLAGYRMGVGPKPDFVVTSVTGPYSVKTGVSFTASVGVCNRGQQTGTVDVELYLSADTTVRAAVPPLPPEDRYLGTISGISLGVGGCTTRSLVVTAPSVPEGAYYLGAVADPYNMGNELLEDNNALAGNVIGVGSKADFVVTSVTGPYSVKPGNSFTVSTTVCNRGQLADVTDVELYLSADTNVRVPAPPLPPEDKYLGTITNVSLAVGACASRSLTVTAPSVLEGAYYLGAVADPYNGKPELIEDNNSKAGNVIGVGNRADFVVTAVTGPASVARNGAFSASVTVCNRGQLTDSVDVELYFSADSIIRAPAAPLPPEDYVLGTLPSVTLAPGACSTRSLTVNAYVPSSGSYYLGAIADPYSSRVELIEDNNSKAGTFMSITP